MIRITEKDLEKEAADLSKLTNQKFSINYSNGSPHLHLTKPGVPGHKLVFLTETKREMYTCIRVFHAGIELGIYLATGKETLT